MNVKDWLSQLSTELDLDFELSNDDVRTLLDVSRDAAHGIERLAAPLTTFVLGVAVGRGLELPAAATTATDLLAASTAGD